MESKFSKQKIQDYSIVTLDGQEIPMSSHFKYLGSIIQKDGEIIVMSIKDPSRLVEIEERNRKFYVIVIFYYG